MCLRLGRPVRHNAPVLDEHAVEGDIWDSLALHEDEVMAIEPIEIAAIA